ncbi:aminotransferase class I/II-fold pyridoxal phosphate-dependent enzyme [Tenacibaculum sp. 1_MG-2023]|uniref:pyridoxal phosphate-dependent aminotransferase n=1 Tax=Tenacibaculum sp. 1_MG-2023 TaxID=3062653 RepID=UPI0026E1D490|nr:aminotransferase class I/II-fold pyridoxal phosphate-dependent enzyme [Tenacibaculum sp. 1_MG-2023]MDO6676278.1 aminotransferase class I/II-fold pyridoxal phosphate-dependent enzyme [Tenacibaculum sp. 1_MG-2023]
MIQFANRLQTVQEYYFSKKLQEVRQLITEGKPIINIGIGSPDLQPPSSVLKAIQDSLLDTGAHSYQSYQGLPEFRQAVANFYQNNYNVTINPANEVLPLMGSKEGIMHISLAFLNEGDQALIPNPGYPTYSSVTNLLGGEPVFYDLEEATNWQPNFEALEKLDTSRIKLMWINYPHMPTGADATKETFQKLIDFGKKHNVVIVNDNPYSFILNEHPQSILQIEGAKDIALELNSVSKSFNMAGWRVGMLLGKPEFLTEILKVKTQMDSGMFYGIQKGATKALELDKDWFTQLNNTYKKRQELVFELAKKLGCTYDKNASGMFVWCKLPKGKTAEEMIDDLLYDKHIFAAPGIIFGNQGEGYIRFSLCVPEEKINEAINRI